MAPQRASPQDQDPFRDLYDIKFKNIIFFRFLAGIGQMTIRSISSSVIWSLVRSDRE